MQTPTKGKALVGIIYQRKFQGKKYREEQGEPIMIKKKFFFDSLGRQSHAMFIST